MVVLAGSPISAEDFSWIDCWVPGHFPDQGPSCLDTRFGQTADSRKSPGGFTFFFHFTIIESTVLLGTLKALVIVLYPSPDLCRTTKCYYRGNELIEIARGVLIPL